MSRGDTEIIDYLLGELAQGERERVERRMREDPGFRRRVDRMRAVVGTLGDMPAEAWDPPAPPPLPAVATPPAPARPWRSGALRPALAVAACVALLGAGVAIGALAFGGGGDGDATGSPIALRGLGEAAPAASGVARTVAADEGGLRVEVRGLAPSEAGAFYELWLLGDGERMVALGSFRVPATGATTITVPLPGALADYRFIDVSVEPDDGNPGHSGRSVLRAPTTA